MSCLIYAVLPLVFDLLQCRTCQRTIAPPQGFGGSLADAEVCVIQGVHQWLNGALIRDLTQCFYGKSPEIWTSFPQGSDQRLNRPGISDIPQGFGCLPLHIN